MTGEESKDKERPDEDLRAVDEKILAEAEAKPPWKRMMFLALLAAVLLAIVYLSPLRAYLGRVQEWKADFRALGVWAPVVLTLGIAVLVATGFPRLLFCVIAGVLLGFWQGLLWAQLGTLLGNYAIFLIARKSAGNWVRRYVAKRGKLASLIHEEGIAGVILARQLPVPGMLVNLALGLLAVKYRDFLLGTILGQLPEAIPCTLFGAGAGKASLGKSAGFMGLAVAVAVIAWIILRWYMRKRGGRDSEPHDPGARGGA